MIHRLRRHTISFKHAFAGMMWAINSQPNYIIHAFLSLLSLVWAIYFQVTYVELLVIIVLVFTGLTIETINTSIEKVCDAITRDINPDIKIAKDVAAGAMLIYAIGALIVAVIIFLPRILNLLGYN